MSERQNWLAANIDQMNDEYWRVVGERDAERAYAEACERRAVGLRNHLLSMVKWCEITCEQINPPWTRESAGAIWSSMDVANAAIDALRDEAVAHRRTEIVRVSTETDVPMLPCPFCGGTDIDAGFSSDCEGNLSAGCMTCSSCGPDDRVRDAGAAARAWNRRHAVGNPQTEWRDEVLALLADVGAYLMPFGGSMKAAMLLDRIKLVGLQAPETIPSQVPKYEAWGNLYYYPSQWGGYTVRTEYGHFNGHRPIASQPLYTLTSEAPTLPPLAPESGWPKSETAQVRAEEPKA